MAKQSQIDKLIAQIQAEIDVLEGMRARLIDANQSKRPVKKPRVVVKSAAEERSA